MLGIPDDDKRKLKRKKKSVTFNEEEEIINPEDIDPSVGRFRNLVQTTVIPSSKRPRMDSGLVPTHATVKHYIPRTSLSLYDDLPDSSVGTPFFTTLSSKLDLPLPNPAPDIEPAEPQPLKVIQTMFNTAGPMPMDLSDEPKKKKYAKEAWPGKKQGAPNLLL